MQDEIKKVEVTLPSVSPINSSKIKLSNEMNTDIIFCSVFPQLHREKPTNIGTISSFIAKFPNTFTLDQLKEEVATNGKSFIGCFFFDVDFYKQVYGGFKASAIVDQSIESAYLLWCRNTLSYMNNLGEEQAIFESHNYLSNKVRLKENCFILMSTFGLDVDHKQNEKGEDITPAYGKMYEEVKQRIVDLDLNTLFAYKTFSDPTKGERFRVVFKTDVPIFSWDLAHSIYFGLVEIFEGYMDEQCTNVNRIFHGSNTIINEENPLFGTSIPLDKYFSIVAQCIKEKDKSNYSRNLEKFAMNTGLVIRNNAFAIRTIELSEEQIQELRNNELNTYNKDFMKDYHFGISAETHKEFFEEENFDEIVGTYYIYLIRYDDFVNKNQKSFYEICMSIPVKTTSPIKEINEDGGTEEFAEESVEEKTFKAEKQKCKIEQVQIKDWNVVEQKCELYKILVTGKRRIHHQEMFGLATSLMYIVGGAKRLLEAIENFSNIYDKLKDKEWKEKIDYNKRACYFPVNCDNFCPLYSTCNHLKNMKDTVAPRNGIFVIKDFEYVDISEVENQLWEEIRKFYSKGGGYFDW